MRRRSFLGPIILILLGTMFLVHQFRPDIAVWRLWGEYWPLLLIVIGLLKLAQAMTPHDPAMPSRPLITGGEVFLLFLLCMIGFASYRGSRWGVNMDLPPDFFGDWSPEYNYTGETEQSVPEAQPEILIVNASGDVRVEGTDHKQIQVKVDKHVRAMTEEDARRAGDSATPRISKEGSQYVVRVDAPQGRRISFKASLDVQVPMGSIVRVENKRGDVTVHQVGGAVNVTLDHGDVTLEDIGGQVHLDLRRGSVNARRIKNSLDVDGRANGGEVQVADVDGDVVVHGEYSDQISFANLKKSLHFTSNRTEIQIQHLPGRMEMSIGSLTITDPGGAVTIHSREKELHIENFDGPVEITDSNASIEMSTNKQVPNISVENKSGKIELSLPGGSSFQVDGSARRGDVNSEFDGVSSRHENDNGTLSGTVGRGGATIKLNTTYGSINLRKHG